MMHHLAAGQTLFDLLLALFAVAVMPAISARNGRAMKARPAAPLARRYLLMLLRGWLVAAAIGVLWYGTGRAPAALGLDLPLGPGGEIGLGIAALAIGFAIIVQSLLARLMTPERSSRLREQMGYLKILPRTTLELCLFLGVSLTAGVWEELLYRGFFFWFLTPYTGLAAAVILSALVFGIGHVYQGWRGAMNAGTLGFLFALGYALTHSLWWLMAIHALVDAFGGVMTWRVSRMAPPKNAAPA